MFINRHAELANLETHYRSERAELFVLYGRRRVGKTELLRHFCADKPHVFFIATLSSRFRPACLFFAGDLAAHPCGRTGGLYLPFLGGGFSGIG